MLSQVIVCLLSCKMKHTNLLKTKRNVICEYWYSKILSKDLAALFWPLLGTCKTKIIRGH